MGHAYEPPATRTLETLRDRLTLAPAALAAQLAAMQAQGGLVARAANRQLLFLAGQRPTVAAKLRYYDDCEFAGQFDPA